MTDGDSFETLDIRLEDELGWILIDREESLNSLSWQTIDDLHDAVLALDQTDEVRVIAIRGAGEKAFSAGAHLNEFLERSTVEQMAYLQSNIDLYDVVDTAEKPVIAAVNGIAFGGGAELILACDIRLASTNATFSEAEIRVGLIPFSKRLMNAVGISMATELCLTGRDVDAVEGNKIGLFNRIVAPDELDDEVRSMAATIAANTESSVRLTKESLLAGRNNSLEDATVHSLYKFYRAFETEEAHERIRDFVDR